MRLDLVDPEALLQQGAGLVQQLLQLTQGEGAHLQEEERKPVSYQSGDDLYSLSSFDLSIRGWVAKEMRYTLIHVSL